MKFEYVLYLLVMVAFIYGDEILALIQQALGRPKVLTKKQARKLEREHAKAIDLLREVEIHDRHAIIALPTETHERLTEFLKDKPVHVSLPPRADV